MGEWDTAYATQASPDAADTVLSRDVSATPPSGGTVKDLPLGTLLDLFLSLGGTFTAPVAVTSAVATALENTAVDAFLQVMNVLAPNLANGDASVFQVGRSLSTGDALQLIHLTANGGAPALAFLGLFGTGNGIWTDANGGLYSGPFGSARNTLDDGSGNAVISGTLATDGGEVVGGASDLNGGKSGWLSALANRHYSALATVAFIGDSGVAGNGTTAWERSSPIVLQELLNEKFPSNGLATHGRGLLIPVLPFTGLTPDYVTITGTPAAVFGNGFNRATYDISATGGCTLTYSLVGDQFYLYYANQPGGGSFDWAIDGGPVNTVSTSAGTVQDGQVIGIPGGAVNSTHTLVIAWHSGGPVWIDGVLEYNGDTASGIQAFNCGNPGSATSDWMTQDFSGVAGLFASLYVIELGAEDSIASAANNADPATFKANMITILDAIVTAASAAGAPVPSFALMALYGIPADAPFLAPWSDYVAEMYAIAAARTDTFVMDLSTRMAPASAGGDYASDAVHPSDIGSAKIADMLAELLGPQ